MTSEMSSKTVSLNVIKAEKQAKVDEEVSSFVNSAIDSIREIFTKEPDSKGLLAIVYDKNNDPKIVWGGDMDYVKMIGSLDLAKMELIAMLMSTAEIQDGE